MRDSFASDPARRGHLAVVAGLFLASRLLLIGFGLRFQADPYGQDQLLDAGQLASDPFLAFTSNHIQPPLWNFFVGAVMRWSPFPMGISFQVIYLATGLATVICLWGVLRGLGARRWIATVATTLVGWSPLTIANERILRYETFETFVLTASALAFLRYVRRPSPGRLAAFSLILVVGVLTRTTLTPIWLLGGLGIAFVCRPPRGWWRSATAVATVALLLVALPIAHRATRFDTLGLSSLWGTNLRRITTMQLPNHELQRLIRNGTLSPMSFSLGPYRAYARYLPPCSSHTGEQVLDNLRKTHGDTNFNALCMLPVYRQQAKDALATIRADPGNYLHAVKQATALYVVWPKAGKSSPDAIRRLDAISTPLVLPINISMMPGGGDPQPFNYMIASFGAVRISITVVAGLILALVFGLQSTWAMIRRRADTTDGLRVYIGFTVLALTVVSVTMDFYENPRFRQPLDPLILGPLFVVVLELATNGFERWFRTGGAEAELLDADPVKS